MPVKLSSEMFAVWMRNFQPISVGEKVWFSSGIKSVRAPEGATHVLPSMMQDMAVFFTVDSVESTVDITNAFTCEGDWQSWHTVPVSAEELDEAKKALIEQAPAAWLALTAHRKDSGQLQIFRIQLR